MNVPLRDNLTWMSGNEAIALGAYEAGVAVASGYPGTPSTEIMEYLSAYDTVYTEWAPNEKVGLEVAIGASFAGVGGIIFAARQGSIFPDDFSLMVSINVLCLIIIGGMGSITGVILGAVILIGVPEVLRAVALYRMLAFGALLVIMMVFRPTGFIASSRRKLEFKKEQ